MAINYNTDIVTALFASNVATVAAYQAPGTFGLPTGYGSFKLSNTSTIAAAGTSYVVGNILTLTGGTRSVAATIRVNSVSSGVVLTFEVINPGVYTVLPSNPISVTGGGGSGFTLTGVWAGPADQRILMMIEIVRSYIGQMTTLSEQKMFQAVMRRMISEMRFGGPATFTATANATNAQLVALKYLAALPGELTATL